MSRASAYINKIRADTEGRNTKREYPGAILEQNYKNALVCSPSQWNAIQYDPSCKNCGPSQVYYITNATIVFNNDLTHLIVSWNVYPPVSVKVDIYSEIGVIESQTAPAGTTTITSTTGFVGDLSYYAVLTPLKFGNSVQTPSITYSTSVVSNTVLTLYRGDFTGNNPPYLQLSWNVSPPSSVTADFYVSGLVNSQIIPSGTTTASFNALYGGQYYYGTVTPPLGITQTSSSVLVMPLATNSLSNILTTSLNFNMSNVLNVLIRYYNSVSLSQLGSDISRTYTGTTIGVVPTVTPTSGINYTCSVFLAPNGTIATSSLADVSLVYKKPATISNVTITYSGNIGDGTIVLNTSFTTDIPTIVYIYYIRAVSATSYNTQNLIATHSIDSTETTHDSCSYAEDTHGYFAVNGYYFVVINATLNGSNLTNKSPIIQITS